MNVLSGGLRRVLLTGVALVAVLPSAAAASQADASANRTPSFAWTQESLLPNSSYRLSTLFRTTSTGKRTWSASGTCTLSGVVLTTGAAGVCRLTVAIQRTVRHSPLKRQRSFSVASPPRTTSQTAAPRTTSTSTTVPFNASAFEDEVLRLTNSERAKEGLSPLTACSRLAASARAHSDRMITGQFFAHTDPDTNSRATDRIRLTGYLDDASSWGTAENIAYGYSTPTALMDGWMNSPGHRANIMNPTLTHIGVGVAIGVWQAWKGKYSGWDAVVFSTQNFGRGGTCG